MKKSIYAILIVLVCCFAMVGYSKTAEAATGNYYDTVKNDVVDGGYRILKVSTVDELDDALETAKNSATDKVPYKIVVKPGKTYRLEHSVRLYSNTYLYARDASFVLAGGSTANMIHLGDLIDSHTGYYYKNVTVDGGLWDEKNESNTLIKLAHGKNITVKNAVFQNVYDSHIMEVAGIDGLTITNCKFLNQALPKNAKHMTYEAIQLDILVKDHLKNYRYEDLQLKNVSVTNCEFNNVPRGVGSHTAVLNSPIENITITNNTFSNMKSCAIQLLSVKKCEISNNKIKSSPRGIAVFGGVLANQGTYLSTTLANQGNTAAKTSVKYKKPGNMGIVIKNNTITLKGSDPYASYERSGIWINGFNTKAAYKSGDKIPKGNYYVTGVTVTGNTVKGNGQGVRLVNVRNGQINNNKLTFSGKVKNINYYGINIKDGSKTIKAAKNKIAGGYVNGIYLQNAAADSITNNTVTNNLKYNISIEKSTVKTISGNKVKKAKLNGIHIWDKSKATRITKNTVSSAKNRGIYVGGKSRVTKITGNKISSCGERLYANPDSKVTKKQK